MTSASPQARDRGFTLVEMLVAISLLAIVSTLITTLVVTVSQTFTREESEQDSSRTAAVGMQQVTRIIRAGAEIPLSSVWQALPAFESARADSLILNTYLDTETTANGPTRIRLELSSARELVETRWSAQRSGGDWVYRTTPARTHVVVRDVVRQGSALAQGVAPPMFIYLRANGTEITPPSGGALTEAQRREIAAVRVSLAVQTAPGSDASATQLVSTVALPSVGLTRTGL